MTANRKRLYPSYTLAELEAWKDLSPETAAKVAEEIAAREAGATHKQTPQASWGDVKRPTIPQK